jgi:nicotinate-nucleotide adenylyltransferase
MAAVKGHSLPALMGEPLAPGLRIGLLGGSFNPAHEGHLHISREALRRLRLDQVWWLVSPKNPLKPKKDMAKFKKRFASAETMARDPRIRVTKIEKKLGTRYTVDTVNRLTELGPDLNFVFLMGADNFVQLPAWRNWQDIMATVPIAVLARPGFEWAAPMGKAASRFAANRLSHEDAPLLPELEPPAWVFLPIPLHPASATRIRHHGKW